MYQRSQIFNCNLEHFVFYKGGVCMFLKMVIFHFSTVFSRSC